MTSIRMKATLPKILISSSPPTNDIHLSRKQGLKPNTPTPIDTYSVTLKNKPNILPLVRKTFLLKGIPSKKHFSKPIILAEPMSISLIGTLWS